MRPEGPGSFDLFDAIEQSLAVDVTLVSAHKIFDRSRLPHNPLKGSHEPKTLNSQANAELRRGHGRMHRQTLGRSGGGLIL
jgi:hypothetical protein